MKRVLITGAGSGIGRATAIEFSTKGYHCLLVGRNQDKLKETAAALPGPSGCLSLDITQLPGELKVKEPIHALIHNAGTYSRAELKDCQKADWIKAFEVNIIAAAELTKRLLNHLVDHESSIINVSSTLGHRPVAGTGIYSATKAAMNNWTKTMALELAPRGIRVNCVCPGIVDTPIHDFHESVDRDSVLKQMAGLQPLGRIGNPQEIAKAIYFLASSESSWTTGALFDVDGGINL